MFETSKHPSDEEILQFIDQELPADRLEKLRRHLMACPECHERQTAIENGLEALHALYQSEPTDSSAMTAAASRIRLQEKIAEYRRERSISHSLIPAWRLRLPIAVATILAAVGLAFYSGEYIGKFRRGGVGFAEHIVPDRSFTPGAVRSVSLNEICSVSDDDLDPKVSSATEIAVLKEYGMPPDLSAAQRYQIDYLVNPQLGGTNDIKNLWPQPYNSGRWNAHAKDVLEQHLHQMVCNGTINLTVAQREIADDWIAAYKKYVGREGS